METPSNTDGRPLQPVQTVVGIGRSQQTLNPKIKDPGTVEEVLVDGLLGIHVAFGLPRLTFFAERFDHAANSSQRVAVARLAMTPDAANMLGQALLRTLNQMVEDQAIPPLQPIVFE